MFKKYIYTLVFALSVVCQPAKAKIVEKNVLGEMCYGLKGGAKEWFVRDNTLLFTHIYLRSLRAD